MPGYVFVSLRARLHSAWDRQAFVHHVAELLDDTGSVPTGLSIEFSVTSTSAGVVSLKVRAPRRNREVFSRVRRLSMVAPMSVVGTSETSTDVRYTAAFGVMRT